MQPKIWGQALNGVAFDLLNPRIDDVDFSTIATALSRIPRFLGHTNGSEILSVAQHCVEGALAIERDGHPPGTAAAFLLHDAHEAYTGDITAPVQKALGRYMFDMTGGMCGMYPGTIRGVIAEMQNRIDSAIYQAAGLEWPIPAAVVAVVTEYDARMCVTEARARLDAPPFPWGEPYASAAPLEGVDVWSSSQEQNRMHWLGMARRLLPVLQPRCLGAASRYALYG